VRAGDIVSRINPGGIVVFSNDVCYLDNPLRFFYIQLNLSPYTKMMMYDDAMYENPYGQGSPKK